MAHLPKRDVLDLLVDTAFDSEANLATVTSVVLEVGAREVEAGKAVQQVVGASDGVAEQLACRASDPEAPILIGEAEILGDAVFLSACSSQTRAPIIWAVSVPTSELNTSRMALSVSYFKPCGSLPPSPAVNPNRLKRLTTNPSERGADK